MIKIGNKILINASAKRTAEWFKTVLPYSYLKIHPIDHLELKKLTHGTIKIGSTFRLREKIGQKFYLNTKIKISELTDHSFAFKGEFPYSLINLSAKFVINKVEKNKIELVAENVAGWRSSVVSLLTDPIFSFFLPIKVLTQHMKEENEGMKREIELFK